MAPDRSASNAELYHIGHTQVDMPGQALKRPGPAFDTRSIETIAVQGLIRIQRAGVRLFAGSFFRAQVHFALDHVNVVNRSTFGTVDGAFPVPEAVRIQIINGVTGLSLKIFFTPDYITHSSHLLL
jgi:hypothetical protein